jgi:hypothetical protein
LVTRGWRHGTVPPEKFLSHLAIVALSPRFVFLDHFPERGCMSVHLLGTIRFVLPKISKLLMLRGQATLEWYKSLTAVVFARHITIMMSLFLSNFLRCFLRLH